MVTGHSNNHKETQYSIFWDIIYGDADTITVSKDIMEEYDLSEIIRINENRSFLYDRDYNILGIVYGSLNFFSQ